MAFLLDSYFKNGAIPSYEAEKLKTLNTIFDLESPIIHGLILPYMDHLHVTSRKSQVKATPQGFITQKV